ncbi:hypothetical protein Acr_27g0000620 [Actinidia rufa]|uniref:Uncharacterized protein n=1 Tax=Actinidia rufa TaxID=165716 RepID=A0A7J0H5E4_9ERIC|nr:hypothetical protein Acr_27g0000620 [Actinidia rufa]
MERISQWVVSMYDRILVEIDQANILPRQGRGGDSTLALGDLTSTLKVAMASSMEMTWRGRGSKGRTLCFEGVVISEGSETTSGKRALDDGSKGKQVAQSPELKKARIDTGASRAPRSRPLLQERILAGVITPADKEKVDKLSFDQVVTKFITRSARYLFFLKDGFERQNRAIELEDALAEEKAKGKKLAEDADAREARSSRSWRRGSPSWKKSQSLTQGRIIAAFKESDDFLEAVRGSASSYFGDGFDFCKRQLVHQYPDLGVDLEDVEMDHEFFAKEEAEAEQRAAEEGAAGAEGVGEAV